MQNNEPNDYNYCDPACAKRAAFIALTGISLAAGGIGIGAEVSAELAMDESSANALESISTASKAAAVGAGAGAFALRPTVERGLMVGAGAALLFTPLPEVTIFAEIFLESEEIYNATNSPNR